MLVLPTNYRDTSHVSLVALFLRASGFDHYRCDRSLNLGISLPNLGKIIKTCGNDDSITLSAEDKPDVLNLLFESQSISWSDLDNDRVSEFDMKLMDIDAEVLAIPEAIYDAVVKLPAAEFTRICRDMLNLSENSKSPNNFSWNRSYKGRSSIFCGRRYWFRIHNAKTLYFN
jgi:proliferating cell nuclear antigen